MLGTGLQTPSRLEAVTKIGLNGIMIFSYADKKYLIAIVLYLSPN
jgi:hypothetical protein